MQHQNLTADVLNFIQLMEDQKRKFKSLQPVGITAFAQLAEQASQAASAIESPEVLASKASATQKSDNLIDFDAFDVPVMDAGKLKTPGS